MMPEGPEVRTLVDQLQGGIGKRLVDVRFLSGRYIQQRPKGFKEFAQTMTPMHQQRRDENKGSDNDNVNSTIDTILDINCKGKFIYMLLDDGSTRASNNDDDDFQRSIWITLGMTGRFVNEQKHLEDSSYGRWVLELVDATSTNTNDDNHDEEQQPPPSSAGPIAHKIYYHDKRNFGTVKFCLSKLELDQKLASLGPDVLAQARRRARVDVDDIANVDDIDDGYSSVTIDDELDAHAADAAATQEFLGTLAKQRNKQINICKFLMDQKKISGVGNYILSEALYRSSIDPFCGIDELSTSQRIKLFQQIKTVCYESYVSQQQSQSQQTKDNTTSTTTTGGSISTGSGYTSVRSLEPFEFQLRVYGQLKCPKGSSIVRETKGPHGRTIWYTNDQLFVARHIREQREQQGGTSATTSTSTAEDGNNENRWTITRKDGVELGNTNNENGINNRSNQNVGIGTKGEVVTNMNDGDSNNNSDDVWNILDGLHEPGWKQALKPYTTSSNSFESLQVFIEEECAVYGPSQIYPPRHQVFSALNLCPLDKVKVVILGQDPYHGPNQSTGLAFSVSKSISKIPPSLRNIFKELDNDVGGQSGGPPPTIRHGDLEGWAKQGVLMLNTVLTVRRGQANSHKKRGWEDFTDEIVCILRDQANKNNKDSDNSSGGIVFLLWGGPAAKKAKSIVDSDAKHVVIATSHPSPLGATKTASPFLTSGCFSRVNEALVEMGKTPIDWYDR
mmetsp:Transcript_16164/g.35089  ORF Transcript_16164/g.35089 Transcript_16164/m.35089 type:complete len:731 (-) Transcript_16164:329-2521(-)